MDSCNRAAEGGIDAAYQQLVPEALNHSKRL